MNESKLNVLLSAICLVLVGCSNPEGQQRSYVKNLHHCTEETKQDRAEFILTCIENANPKSDEEPEDWITDCKWMAEQTLCKKEKVTITEQCAHGESLLGSCSYWRETNRVPAGG